MQVGLNKGQAKNALAGAAFAKKRPFIRFKLFEVEEWLAVLGFRECLILSACRSC